MRTLNTEYKEGVESENDDLTEKKDHTGDSSQDSSLLDVEGTELGLTNLVGECTGSPKYQTTPPVE